MQALFLACIFEENDDNENELHEGFFFRGDFLAVEMPKATQLSQVSEFPG